MSFLEQTLDLIRVFVLFFGILIAGSILVVFLSRLVFKRRTESTKVAVIMFSISALAAMVCFYGLPKNILLGIVYIILGIIWFTIFFGYYYVYLCWSMEDEIKEQVKVELGEKWRALVINKKQALGAILVLTSIGLITTMVFLLLFSIN